MNDRPIIVAGVVAFLVAVTFPVWYNVAARTNPVAPSLARPSAAAVSRVRGERAAANVPPACVAPRDLMRTSHMRLLVAWREDVVRRNDRAFVAYDGRHYEKNLAGTCWGCHDDKKQFCDRCHDYAGVGPTCGDCHLK